MKNASSILDELAHELNGLQVLFDIWHEKTPPGVRRRLRNRMSTMRRLLEKLQRLRLRSAKDLERLAVQIKYF